MKKITVFLAVFAFVSGFCFGADPAEGFWLSVDEKSGKATGGWEIYVSGGKLFGRVLSLAEKPQDQIATNAKESYEGFPVAGKVNEMKVVGTTWIFNLSLEKQPGSWSGGYVVDPTDGKMYRCEITFHPQNGKKYLSDTLEMRGKVGPFGRSQYWQKCSREEASALR